MKRIMFITYNKVGDGVENGWYMRGDHDAFVLQNPPGFKGDARENHSTPFGDKRLTEECVTRVVKDSQNIWQEAQTVLSVVDHVVIYLGWRGSEKALEFVAQLPTDKITFVSCKCRPDIKLAILVGINKADARVIPSECGGHDTLSRLLVRFLESGELQLDEV